MRPCLIGLTILMLGGCAGTKPDGAGSSPKAGDYPCFMQSGNHQILRMTINTDSACTSKDGAVHLHSAAGDFDVWHARNATTVDDAIKRIPTQIESEFKNFKATSTTPTEIAGSPAKRLAGDGVEADDNDPGTADVIVFKTGPNIFIACTHAETLRASARDWMGQVVATARVP